MQATMKPQYLFKFWILGGGRRLLASLGLGLALVAGMAPVQAQVSATVSGQIAPGVYGRVDIGNGPPPALWYAQPMVISPQPLYVQRAPIYMYVPPGHAKNWAKHCARYAACGQPVYFVKEPPRRVDYRRGDRDGYDRHYRYDRRGEWRDHHRDDDRGGRGNGRGNGRGESRGHDRGHGRSDR